MARQENTREDLLAEATALVERAEISIRRTGADRHWFPHRRRRERLFRPG